MDQETLRIGQRVEIDVDLPGFTGTYSSRVEDMTDTSLTLALPSRARLFVPLTKGQTIIVSFWGDSVHYSSETRVLERRTKPLPVVIVERPTNFKRHQRRNFVRFDARLPLQFYRIQDREPPEESPEVFTVETTDISGGGVSFLTSMRLEMKCRLQLELALPGDKPVKAIGSVVRVVNNPRSVRKRYRVGVSFLVIEERDRDRIIKFIFARQRELRRKGLL